MTTNKGFKQTEIGTIPEDWEVVRLSELASFFNGKAHENTISETGQFAVVNSKFISSNGTVVKFSLFNYCELQKDDIAIVMSDIPNGKALAKCFIVDKSGYYALNQRIGGIRVNNVAPQYLFYQLNRNHYYLSFDSGSGQTNLRKQEVLDCPIKTPPTLAEQTAIATALSDMDALITQTDRLIQKKKAIKQGLMQELLSPKEGWEKIKLGDAIKVSRGGSPRPIQNYLTSDPNGINWIKIGDTSPTSKYITSTNDKIIAEGVISSRQVFVGDFLLSNSMSFGRPYILKIDGCIHDGWLVLQDYQTIFNRDFLYYFLSSSYVLNQYKNLAAGSSVLNLNKDIVEKVFLEKPASIEEQVEIASILSLIDEEITLLETKRAKLHAQKQGMMQVLLTGKIRLNP